MNAAKPTSPPPGPRSQQATTAIDQARATLELAQQTLKRQQDLAKDGLTTREALERAQNDVTIRESELKTRQQEVETREQQIKQEQAGLSTTRYNLSQVTIASPMDGIITRRNIEEGENVVVGTMNNAGTVLLTVADMSAIQAEIEVDETDIPTVTIGQAAVVTIDAAPDRMFKGHVTEIGNSPIQTAAQTNATTGQGQATNFKVVVTIDDPVPDVRPGFTCTAEITTATRKNVVAVPDSIADRARDAVRPEGTLVHEPPPPVTAPVFRGRCARHARAAAGPAARADAEGNRRRVHRARRARGVPASEGRDRGRTVLRGRVRIENGRSSHHRPVQLRPRARGWFGRHSEQATLKAVQLLESVTLALQTIWENKLRSLMTVLGNIVAVSSIVTVVSLIQGMNAMVSNAIVTEASADAFTIHAARHLSIGRRARTHAAEPVRDARRRGRRSRISVRRSAP